MRRFSKKLFILVRRVRSVFFFCLILYCLSCNAFVRKTHFNNEKIYEQSNKIVSIETIYFQQDSPGVRITYETDIQINDISKLRIEVCELAKKIIKDVEKQRYRNCLFRARERSSGQPVEILREYTFVFIADDLGGGWKSTDTELTRLCPIRD